MIAPRGHGNRPARAMIHAGFTAEPRILDFPRGLARTAKRLERARAYALPIAFCQAGRSLTFVHQALTCGYFANVAFTGVTIAYSK
jgi:hypothetical protein